MRRVSQVDPTYVILPILNVGHEAFYVRLHCGSGEQNCEISGFENRGITEKCVLHQFESCFDLAEMHGIE